MVCLFRIFQRFLFLRNHHRSPDADEQYEDDEYQRTDCINLEEIVDEHLHTDEQQLQDEARTEFLNKRGFYVMRFTNQEVMNEIDNVIETIEDFLNE